MGKALTLLSLLFVLGCEAEEIGPQSSAGPSPPTRSASVLLINEGNFQRGNASLGSYDPALKQYAGGLYRAANGNLPLGDVFQDMAYWQGRYYLTINNSGVVKILDSASFEQIGTINELSAPRFLTLAEDRLFITDLFTPNLWIIDPHSGVLDTVLRFRGATGRLLRWDGQIVQAVNNRLFLIDPQKSSIIDTLLFPGPLERAFVDFHENLVILQQEGFFNAGLWRVDRDKQRKRLLSFPSGEEISLLTGHASRPEFYFLREGDLYRAAMSADSLFGLRQWQELELMAPYGLNLDPFSGDVYLSEALDFDQDSRIYRWNEAGEKLDEFTGGRITNGFYFRP